MNLVKYLKENPRKILENLTSYLTIIIAIVGVLIAEGSGIGLTSETIASTVAVTAILNRILTFIRVNYLKNEIIELE